jgi:hypothetical protein
MPPVGAAAEGQLDKRAELDQPRRLVGRRLRIGRSLSDRHLHASNASAGVRTCLSRKRGGLCVVRAKSGRRRPRARRNPGNGRAAPHQGHPRRSSALASAFRRPASQAIMISIGFGFDSLPSRLSRHRRRMIDGDQGLFKTVPSSRAESERSLQMLLRWLARRRPFAPGERVIRNGGRRTQEGV